MEVILDTHALLWWFAGSDRMSSTARGLIEDPRVLVHVSAASAWEIATKHRLGRLPGAGPLATGFVEQTRGQGFELLDIGAADAQRAGALPGPHRDPFDRMLAAQALARDIALISSDVVLDGWSVRRLW